MPNKDDSKEIAQLQELNEELSESLERCHALLEECRAKLGSGSNDNQAREANEGTSPA
jgi:hypothetical protein